MSEKMQCRIQDLFGQVPPTPFNSKHGTTVMPSPEALVGIELEIEDFPMNMEQAHPGFVFATDGSLRNNGIEAVTKPVRMMHAPGLLSSFYRHFNITEANYSERCSTHVHLNALDLTCYQVASICMLYQTLERLLFNFVGHDRGKNIFCVPWYQSGLTYNAVNLMSSDPNYVFGKWQKYSALNLIPLRAARQGTLEFRHLHGTCDLAVITQWLTLIGRIREYAVNNEHGKIKDILLNMNTVSNYNSWLEEVLQGDVGILARLPNCEEQLSLGVVDTKLMIMTPPKKEVPKPKAFIARDEAPTFFDEEVDPRPATIQDLARQRIQAELARLRVERDFAAAGQTAQATATPVLNAAPTRRRVI